MTEAEEFAAEIIELLAELGEPVTVVSALGPTRDPATGAVIGGPAAISLSGVGYPGRYKASDVDGSNVQATDTRLIVGKLQHRPQKGWYATVDGQQLRLMDVQSVRLSGADVAYVCQARAGS